MNPESQQTLVDSANYERSKVQGPNLPGIPEIGTPIPDLRVGRRQQRNAANVQEKKPGTDRPTSTPQDVILNGISGPNSNSNRFPPVRPIQIPETSRGPFADLNKPPLTPAQEKARDRRAIDDANRVRDEVQKRNANEAANFIPYSNGASNFNPFSAEAQAKRDADSRSSQNSNQGTGFDAPVSTFGMPIKNPKKETQINVLGNNNPTKQTQAITGIDIIKKGNANDISRYRRDEVKPGELGKPVAGSFRGEAIGKLNDIAKNLTPQDVQKILKSPTNSPLNNSNIKALSVGNNSTATNLGKNDILIATGIRNSNNEYVSTVIRPDKDGKIVKATQNSDDKNNILPFGRKNEVADYLYNTKKTEEPVLRRCVLTVDMGEANHPDTQKPELYFSATVQAFENNLPKIDAFTQVKIKGERSEFVNRDRFEIRNSAIPGSNPTDKYYFFPEKPAPYVISEMDSGPGISGVFRSRDIKATNPYAFLQNPRYEIPGTTIDINQSKLKLNSNLNTTAVTSISAEGFCTYDNSLIKAVPEDGITGYKVKTKTGPDGRTIISDGPKPFKPK